MERRMLLLGAGVMGAGVFAVARGLSGGPAAARPAPVGPDDVGFMRLALEEAAKAAFPFGAVIVAGGEVIARGYNRTGVDRDPTAHGEMVAIRAGLREHGPERVAGATLYTSGEPCCMCMGAAIWCGIGRLVYAASLADLGSKVDQIGLSAEDVAVKAPFAPIDIAGGVLAQDAVRLFK